MWTYLKIIILKEIIGQYIWGTLKVCEQMARKNIYFWTTKLEFMQYFSFLKNLFIYFKSRVREWGRKGGRRQGRGRGRGRGGLPQVGSLSRWCNGPGWPRVKPDAQSSIQIFFKWCEAWSVGKQEAVGLPEKVANLEGCVGEGNGPTSCRALNVTSRHFGPRGACLE